MDCGPPAIPQFAQNLLQLNMVELVLAGADTRMSTSQSLKEILVLSLLDKFKKILVAGDDQL